MLRLFVRKWVLIDGAHADVSFLPPMSRRRLSLTTRMALRAAQDCLDGRHDLPSVFSTRYGEYEKSYGILKAISAGEDVSPAAFSHSVHNLASGMYSITTGNTAPSTLVSAGAATLENAVIESSGISRELGSDVLLVHVDAPLPAVYSQFKRDDEQPICLAMLVSNEAGAPLSLSWRPRSNVDSAPLGVPTSPSQVNALLLGEIDSAQLDDGRLLWSWTHGHG